MDITGLMKRGAEYTGDGELLWPVRACLTAAERRALPKPVKPKAASVDLKPSGFAIMRSGWDPDDLYMMINHGPYGGGHSHSHKLDFELFAYGEGLALDTSRFDSYDNPLDVYFRCARAHNQVVVNDANMDERNAKVSGLVWQTDRKVDFFAGTHDGYLASHGVTITRTIVFVKPCCWLVNDLVLESVRRHCYTWYLHSPLRFKSGRGKSFVAGGGPGLQIIPARPDEIRHVQSGVGYGKSDWRSPGRWPERNWIGYQKFDHEQEFATYSVLLCPFRDKPVRASLTPLKVEGAERREAEAFEVSVDGRKQVVVLSHARARARRYGPVKSDHKMAVYAKRGRGWRLVSAVSR